MKYYLYRIDSVATGRGYIGMTTNPTTRRANHLCRDDGRYKQVKDNIAEARIAARIASGKPLSQAGIYAQARKARARQAAGLLPLRGTEHHLS